VRLSHSTWGYQKKPVYSTQFSIGEDRLFWMPLLLRHVGKELPPRMPCPWVQVPGDAFFHGFPSVGNAVSKI
jgi:hypothetical protein